MDSIESGFNTDKARGVSAGGRVSEDDSYKAIKHTAARSRSPAPAQGLTAHSAEHWVAMATDDVTKSDSERFLSDGAMWRSPLARAT